MKTKTLLAAILVATLLPALAEEKQEKFDAFAPAKASSEWKPHPALWRELLRVKEDHPTITIGKAEFEVRGPLVETIRRPRNWSDRSLGQQILGLPVVNLFVPQPLPPAPRGGKYFAWGESSLPWSAVANGAACGSASFINHEPRNGLIYFSR